MKRLAATLAMTAMVFIRSCELCPAADVTPGRTFTEGQQNVTAALMNEALAGTINTTFYTGKPATTTPATTAVVLIYDPATTSFKKVTLGNLVFDHTGLLSARTTVETVATNDTVLLYSPTLGGYRQVTVQSLVLTNALLINDRTETNAPNDAAYVLVQDGTNYFKVALTNLLGDLSRMPRLNWTNSASYSSPTNTDRLWVWQSDDGTNGSYKQITLSNLWTGAVAVTGLTNSDTLLFWSTATNNANGTKPILAKFTLGSLSSYLFPAPTSSTNASGGTNTVYQWHTNFVSQELTIPGPSAAVVTNAAHGLPGTPSRFRCVLVCKTAEAGFTAGDEVPVEQIIDSGASPQQAFLAGVNTTNYFITKGNQPRTFNKSTGAMSSLTTNYWRLKIYATYEP